MSKLFDKLKAGTSGLALAMGLPKLKPKPKAYTVTSKAGKKGQPFRRIVRQETRGPYIRQTGIRWVNGEAHPIMRRTVEHRMYHATKGWRVYHDHVPNIRRAA